MNSINPRDPHHGKWWQLLLFGETLINALCVVLLVSMIGMVFVNVVLRYGFNSGISMSVELSRFIFVWITYLGSILALAHNQHLSISVLYRYLPFVARHILARLVLLVMAGLSAVFAVGSFQQMQINWANAAPISGIAMAIFYLVGLISAVLMCAILLFKCVFTPQALYTSDASDEVGVS